MRLTPGERRALVCYALVLVGFMPPVFAWIAGSTARVLGLPLPLFWAALMVLLTAALMSLALLIKDRSDRR
jgi:ribose/xylose/arabinose/galactoside ABC-type transport system permease subunit